MDQGEEKENNHDAGNNCNLPGPSDSTATDSDSEGYTEVVNRKKRRNKNYGNDYRVPPKKLKSDLIQNGNSQAILNDKSQQAKSQDQDTPIETIKNPKLMKYWHRRHLLWTLYDEGVKMIEEAWYSATPEEIAIKIANRCSSDIAIDGFCGSGVNAIQLARTCGRVIAIDINPEMIDIARHNAKIYKVDNKIEFICGDFLKLAPSLVGDVVFLSPPWGGTDYDRNDFHLRDLKPVSGEILFAIASKITKNIALFLPRSVNIKEVCYIVYLAFLIVYCH